MSLTTRTRLFPAALFLVACAAPFAAGCSASPSEGDDLVADGPEPTDTRDDAVAGGTVAGAAASSCTTGSVKGLSLQIIAEAACLNSTSFVKVPSKSNLSVSSVVNRYLEKPAKDNLVKALDAKSSTMTINSMLRTVAQQYLLYRWDQTNRCGIGLAAKPGNSNHETGLALDVSEYSTWKSKLQAYGFKWYGSGDPVHFDYVGSGAVSHKGLDVKAFQRLWNRNHTNDKIDTDGVWGPQTEARMKKSPAGGFAKGASCSSGQSFETDGELAEADEASGPLGQGAIEEEEHAHVHIDGDRLGFADATPLIDAHMADEASLRCGSCFDTICATDPYCCETSWDDACIATGTAICDTLCAEEEARTAASSARE